MKKIWLDEYPAGIPAEVDVHAYSSLKEVFEASCARFRDLPAYSNMDVRLSYGELEQVSRNFAAFLQKTCGLRKGDRIAILLPNVLQYPVVLFAALRAGLTVVNVNPLYTARELRLQLADSGATAIVVLENFAHTLQEVLDKTSVKTVVTTRIGDMFPPVKAMLANLVVKYVKKMVPDWRIANAIDFKSALDIGKNQPLDDAPLTRDDIAFLQYTGGTTGLAKGAVLTHGHMVANLQQVSAWISRDLDEGLETAVLPLPLYHIYALTSNLVLMKIGAEVVLIANPRDIPALVKTLEKSKPTVMIGVNTLYRALLDEPGFANVDTHDLKLAFAGGMAVQRAVATRWKEVTGTPIIEGYGLTETAPVAIANPLNIDDWTGAIGLPLPSTDATILDDAGKELPVRETGEICLRGPQVMKGYWNRPDETAEAFTPNGWLRTGDMGFMDERGYFTLTDRKKDIILVSGFNVFPNEVEEVAMLHPGVLEAAAIGMPDKRSGEAVKLVVVKKDPRLTASTLIAHCRKSLAAYKAPKAVAFRDEPLPKSHIGKVLRRVLRDEEPVVDKVASG